VSIPADDGMPFFRELQRLLSGSGGPVNWELATQLGVKGLADSGATDATPDATTVSELSEAVRLADLWLDAVTALPSGVHQVQAWSRREWIERSVPAWQALVDPVASRVVAAVQEGMSDSLQQLAGGDSALPPELAGMLPPGADLGALTAQLGSGPVQQMMTQVSGMLFGGQVGQALAALAVQVATGGEVGVPLAPAGTAVLLPSGVAARAALYDVAPDQVRLHLALREAAWVRLVAGVPWLAPRLLGAVTEYAAGIHIDPDALGQALQGMSLPGLGSEPELQGGADSGFFGASAALTPGQQLALTRLETLLALVEGWVEEVVFAAASGRLPASRALRESTRRERAEGGAAEQTFTALVGLSLRPRRLHEAAELWHRLEQARGVTGRDAVWEDPDLLPGPGDLDDPAIFVDGIAIPDDASELYPPAGG
jgi:putative hydrolase